MNYYISDMHFGHKNIMKHSARPFDSVEKMNKVIIQNWNKKVKPTDDVYILGDFCYKMKGLEPSDILKQLNGKLHLIIGNHDKHLLNDSAARKYFVEIKDYKLIEDNGEKIILSHYPMAEWDGYFRGVKHFYGHIHNNTNNVTYKIMTEMIENAYNVGVDILDYEPCTYTEVIEKNKAFQEKGK